MASLSRQARSICPTDTTHTINPRAQRGTSALTLRPIRPQDQPGWSPQDRRNCFHGGAIFSVAQRAQWSQVDSERQLALVVAACVNGVERLIAEARYGVGFALSPDPDDDGLVQAQRRLWPNEGDAPPVRFQRNGLSWLRQPLLHVTAGAAITAR